MNVDLLIFDMQFIFYICLDFNATKKKRRYIDSEICMKNHYYLRNM